MSTAAPQPPRDQGESARGEGEHETRASRRRPLPFGLSLALNVLIALVVISLVQGFLVKVYSVPSGSMEQTLNVGDRMLVNRLAYSGDASPQLQDVVVFTGDDHWLPPIPDGGPVDAALRTFGDITGIGRSNDQALVKRVMGTEGQTVECCSDGGAVLVDGKELTEDYVFEDLPFVPGEFDCSTAQRSPRCFGPLEVPAGHILAMGDHRSNSGDSVTGCRAAPEEVGNECARFVSLEDVVGEVFVTVWPPSNWGGH